MKVKIPHRPIHIAVFLLLAFLCYEAHQLTRHLVGAALCGGFGSMTFTVTITREPCLLPTLVILSGPLLTYGLAWSGMFLLRSSRYRLFAYALIFASFSHVRFIQTLTGRGDELILAGQWFGITSRAVVAAIVFVIGLPPVIAAYRVIANRRRTLVFAGSWLLPLPVLIVLLFGNAYFFGPNGDQIRGTSFLGFSWSVLIIDLAALLLFLKWGLPVLLSQGEARENVM
ncbi:MAG: hypothetical protein ACM3XO_21740 [Bacteroidota bacterium]